MSKKIDHAKLSAYTTFQLGGPCPALYECETPKDLVETINMLADEERPFILIGGGSNIVVSDEGLSCSVVRYFTEEPHIHRDRHKVTVSGSTRFDDLVKFACKEGLGGINYASGIPGSVGGAVVGNAGAFGKQIGDVLLEATLISKDGLLRTVSQKDLGFSYRHSNLKDNQDILLSATFMLFSMDKDDLQRERFDILKQREEKHPNMWTHPCAGSFFRNIEPTSAAEKRQAVGYYLDQVGGKNLSHGGAYIYEKHANIITRKKEATAQDVFELHQKMITLAKDKCALDLVREVRFVGSFEGMPQTKELIW